jgi:large subunit ribosomal protein L15
MPIQRRLPKFGFKNPTRVEYKAVNVAAIQALAEAYNTSEISNEDLVRAGLASKNDLIKVLGNGDITSAVTVTANAFSKSAVSKIEAAGGKTIVIE